MFFLIKMIACFWKKNNTLFLLIIVDLCLVQSGVKTKRMTSKWRNCGRIENSRKMRYFFLLHPMWYVEKNEADLYIYPKMCWIFCRMTYSNEMKPHACTFVVCVVDLRQMSKSIMEYNINSYWIGTMKTTRVLQYQSIVRCDILLIPPICSSNTHNIVFLPIKTQIDFVFSETRIVDRTAKIAPRSLQTHETAGNLWKRYWFALIFIKCR